MPLAFRPLLPSCARHTVSQGHHTQRQERRVLAPEWEGQDTHLVIAERKGGADHLFFQVAFVNAELT